MPDRGLSGRMPQGGRPFAVRTAAVVRRAGCPAQRTLRNCCSPTARSVA